MDQENILYRILSGYYYVSIDDTRYKIIMPNLNIKQEAHHFYLDYMDKLKYDTDHWLSASQIDILLKYYNLWNLEKESQLKDVQNKLENSKVDLYLNFIDIKLKTKNKSLIKSFNKLIDKLLFEKTYFDNLTLESYCNSLKNQHIIMNSIYDSNNKKIFNINDFNNIDSLFLDKILHEIYTHTLSIDNLKSFAKSDLWRSYWDSQKENIFDKHVSELTDDQRMLINISKSLDSIREHMEAPSQEIINDNDALDGWMIHQFRKREDEKKKSAMENRANTAIKSREHSNVFFMTDDPEEKKQIYAMNDAQSRHGIKKMFSTVQKQGSINTKDFTIFRQQQQDKE